MSSDGASKPDVVKELMEMGFKREQVMEALAICEGNKEHALNYLMSSGA